MNPRSDVCKKITEKSLVHKALFCARVVGISLRTAYTMPTSPIAPHIVHIGVLRLPIVDGSTRLLHRHERGR